MKKLSNQQLKIIRNVAVVLGIVVGFLLWTRLPFRFENTSFFHVGNGKYGSKYGALIFLPMPLFAFISSDNCIEEIHTDDSEERQKLEEENARKILKIQVLRAISISLVIWGVTGLAIATL